MSQNKQRALPTRHYELVDRLFAACAPLRERERERGAVADLPYGLRTNKGSHRVATLCHKQAARLLLTQTAALISLLSIDHGHEKCLAFSPEVCYFVGVLWSCARAQRICDCPQLWSIATHSAQLILIFDKTTHVHARA